MTDPHQGVPPGGIALDGQPHGGGFTSALGLVLTEAGPDRARAWAEVGPQHHQDEGIVHQGRTQQVWEVRINRATDGKLVARGQLRLQHIVRREPHAAGNGSRPR